MRPSNTGRFRFFRFRPSLRATPLGHVQRSSPPLGLSLQSPLYFAHWLHD